MPNNPTRYAERFAKSQALTRGAFAQVTPPQPPIIVWPLHYIVFGTAPENVPADLFDNPARLLEFQERICDAHLAAVADDFQPYLTPYYGTGVLASAFGVTTHFAPGRDPSAGSPTITTPADIAKMRIPDPECDGLMPRVLEAAAYMRDHGAYPVTLTDSQSPLDELVLMCGHERLYMWMYDDPKLAHDLFAITTEAFIAWVKVQKAVTGEPLDVCHGEQGVWVPPPCGVWIADDEAVNLPPYLYEEFIAPYYEKIFAEFGGGVLHFCGNGAHIGKIVAGMKGVRAVNSGPMGNPTNFAALQQSLDGKVPLIYQELSPVDPEPYFHDLLSCISLRGLVIAPQVTDRVATGANGGFVDVVQDRVCTAQHIHEVLQRLVTKKLTLSEA
jgi:hypothetical protein